MEKFYITFNNFRKVLLAMELDIPKLYENEFYAKYQNQFGLDLDSFSRKEAKSLVIAQMLVKDFAGTMTRIQIARSQLSQKEWVNSVATPCYHINKDCELLNADFSNVRIPDSVIEQGRSEEYRHHYFENVSKLCSSDQAVALLAICALKLTFDLSEEVEVIQQKYIRKTHYKNSEVAEFNATLNFQEEEESIQKLSDAFNITALAVEPKKRKYSSLIYDESKRKGLFYPDEYSLIEDFDKKKKEITFRILNFYFQSLLQQNQQFTEQFLQLAGLRMCTYCKNTRTQLAHLKELREIFELIPF